MTEKKIRIAAIGAGAWGRNIIRTLHGMDVLSAVAEASGTLRSDIAKVYPDLEAVGCYTDLLHREEIVAVTIATPAPTHHRIAKECLIAGKDVLVEKPMTMNSREAEDLIATAESNGRVLMVGHLLLYKPAIQFIRDYLKSGALGVVYTLHQERMKLGKARSAENSLWSLGVHDVAALLHLVGEAPSEVTFSGHCGLQSGIEDDTYLHMRFPGGQLAHVHSAWLWPEDRRGLRIIGERGMLVYDEKVETVTLIRKRIDSALADIDEGVEVLFQAPAGFQALSAELAHFLECVASRRSPLSSGQSGLDVIRVLEKAGQNS